MFSASLFIIGMLSACVDYDLYNPDDDKPIDTGTAVDPEPEPDPENPDILLYCTEDPDCEALYFGSLMTGCTSDWLQATIENQGAETLVVSDIQVDSSGDANFTIDPSTVPPTLGPSETYTFSLQFMPSAVGTTYTPNLLVTSNDPDTPTAELLLEGTGAEFSTYEECFQQSNYDAVDILWVLDNSGSMSTAINQVKDNFDLFINDFVDLELDYHLGLVTTDMYYALDGGRLRGDPTYLTSDMDPSLIVSSFLETVDEILDREGSGSEQGFDAVYHALNEPLLSGHNAGFFRDYDEYGNEVAIATIIVTDEDNSSGAEVHETASSTEFTDWYTGLKTDPDNVTFSAICGDPSWESFIGCLDIISGISGTPGDEYVYAVDRTNGFWSSICTDDFSEALSYLSLTAAGIKTEFALRYTPTSIVDMTVTVDGVEVDYYSAATGDGWKIDYTTNSLVFYGDAIPGPGSEICVTYQYDPGC